MFSVGTFKPSMSTACWYNLFDFGCWIKLWTAYPDLLHNMKGKNLQLEQLYFYKLYSFLLPSRHQNRAQDKLWQWSPTFPVWLPSLVQRCVWVAGISVHAQLHLCKGQVGTCTLYLCKWSFLHEWKVFAFLCKAPLVQAAGTCTHAWNSTHMSQGHSHMKLHSCEGSSAQEHKDPPLAWVELRPSTPQFWTGHSAGFEQTMAW